MQEDEREIYIRSLFKSSGKLMEEAYSDIMNYQNGVFVPAKTGYDYMDEALLGGIYPQNVITIGARSGVGKSYITQKIVENMMNPTINPQSVDYLLVNCEFEMNPMDLLVRRINRETGKSIKNILLEKQTSIEEKRILEIVQKERRNNVIYIPRPITVEELRDAIDMVMRSSMNKRLVIFKVDHIALIKRNGGDPKRTMDNAIAVINNAKLTYPNIVFIVVSQFNRDIEERRSPKEHAPRTSDFYQSDELGQLSSLMVGLNNPRRMGYEEYMCFPKSWYPNLDNYKTDKRTSFKTEGLLFHHILKVRQIRIEELREPIHPEIMPGYEHLYGIEGGYKYVSYAQPPEPKAYKVDEDYDGDDEYQSEESPYDF